MKVNTLKLTDTSLGATLDQTPPLIKHLYWLADTDIKELLEKPAIAVVGNRKYSAYGSAVTRSICSDLARQGVVIVSGLALGIDSIAHRAALEAGGLTIAVMPAGLDTVYPSSHKNLAAMIIKNGGALISEYPIGVGVQKHHFIARNRIISSLALATLIIEAPRKSGSLHTASFALDQGKPVMAIPGNIDRFNSLGTNQLIKNGAHLITEAADIMDIVGIRITSVLKPQLSGLCKEERMVVAILGEGATDVDKLQRSCRLPLHVLLPLLTRLELKNIASQSDSGGLWQLS